MFSLTMTNIFRVAGYVLFRPEQLFHKTDQVLRALPALS